MPVITNLNLLIKVERVTVRVNQRNYDLIKNGHSNVNAYYDAESNILTAANGLLFVVDNNCSDELQRNDIDIDIRLKTEAKNIR